LIREGLARELTVVGLKGESGVRLGQPFITGST
jgi:hypothetical protein